MPPDVGPYYDLYVTKEKRPCPKDLQAASNAKQLLEKAQHLDNLAGVKHDAADTGQTLADGVSAAGDAADKAGKATKSPHGKAAASATSLGCSIVSKAYQCGVKKLRADGRQLKAWAKEARRQSKLWSAIAKACK